MRRPYIKKYSIVLTAATLVFTLTGCSGAGPNAATRLIKQVTDGAEAAITTDGNDLSISNLLLVAAPDVSAVLIGTIVNRTETPDALLGISAG